MLRVIMLMHYTKSCITSKKLRKVRWKMDFANRGNRPNAAPQQPVGMQQEQQTQSFQPMNNSDKKNKKRFDFGKVTSGVLLIGTTFLVVALILGLVFGVGGESNEADQIQEDNYQAVFLNSQDGQVYFGKLDIYNKDLYVLTDIYYVRVENPIQPEGSDQQTNSQANISLAKLGNELHGPQDVMYIARDKVLYWENLKDEGQVVTAITKYKENGETTPETTDTTNDSTTTTTPTTQTTTPTTTTPAPQLRAQRNKKPPAKVGGFLLRKVLVTKMNHAFGSEVENQVD